MHDLVIGPLSRHRVLVALIGGGLFLVGLAVLFASRSWVALALLLPGVLLVVAAGHAGGGPDGPGDPPGAYGLDL